MIRKSLCLTLLVPLAGFTLADDWPFWRGPRQTGASLETATVKSWSPDGEHLLWKSDIGGRSTPVVMNGRVFCIGPVGEGVGSRERVVCLDATTGKLLWEHRFNVFNTDIVENRVGWPAVVADPETGNVYAHATGGEFFAYDRDGKLLWKHSMTEEYGRISGYGGRLMTPIVDQDHVIISFLNSSWGDHARPLHRYLAFDKNTGDVLWWAAPGGAPLDTTYATPAVGVIGGVRMMVAPNADGNVYGMNARTGERLWTYKLSKRGLNTSAVIDGNYAYASHSEENLNTTAMGAVVCIDATQTGDITDSGTVWRHDGYTVGYCSPALANGRLYVVDNSATLFAADARTGAIFWKYSLGRVGKGSPAVTTDGVIYCGEQTGVFHIVQDAGDKCLPLDRDEFKRDDGLVDEIFGSPAVANGRVYFMSRYGTYCLGDPDAAIAVSSTPAGPKESKNSLLSGAANITPAEVTLSPGDNVRFNWPGAQDAAVSWSVKGVHGSIEGGLFTASQDNAFSAGSVSCTVGGAELAARVRVIPKLPISINFDDIDPGGMIPGWIGVGGGPNKKVVVAELDGQRVLKKLAPKERPSPPFMRLQAYFTQPLPAGYVVQCDLMSESRDARRRTYMPDMGLTNNRYDFLMMGANKKGGRATTLRIETWGAVPRLRKDVEFNWQPGTWYTARFEVRLINGEARCRAKVWPRGGSEPADWQIEVTDPYPHQEGSAALLAYSTGTTAGSDGPATYFDNVKVYRND